MVVIRETVRMTIPAIAKDMKDEKSPFYNYKSAKLGKDKYASSSRGRWDTVEFQGCLQPPFSTVKEPVFPFSKGRRREWEKFASVKVRCGRPSADIALSAWGANSDWCWDVLPPNVPFSPSGWEIRGPRQPQNRFKTPPRRGVFGARTGVFMIPPII